MSTTLSHGFKVPSVGEKKTWFDDLEVNIIKTNDHTHDGVNSAKIKSSSVLRESIIVLGTAFVADSGYEGYKASVTMPSGYLFDETKIVIRDNSSGEEVFAKIAKTAAGAFDIFINNNTTDLRILYV